MTGQAQYHKGRTIRKVMGGIFSLHEFFFSLTACAEIFFSGEPLYTNFYFQTKYCFFVNSEILIHYLCFCDRTSQETSTFTDKRKSLLVIHIQDAETFFLAALKLPACRRLLFPLLHAEKGRLRNAVANRVPATRRQNILFRINCEKISG